MARKSNLGSLIHCEACGEDYSATYRRCPFCGQPPQGSRPPRNTREIIEDELDDEEDGYVFDGQDAFDDQPEPPRPVRAKGGKRLASNRPGPSGSRRASQSGRASGGAQQPPAPINWPRLITFLCSLVIIAAALVIVFTFIYPQLRRDPGVAASDPAGNVSQNVPASQAPIGGDSLTSLALDTSSVTLMAGETYQLVLSFEPADWAGDVTWTSSDEDIVTVSSTGLLSNVNGTAETERAIITVTAGGQSAQCDVYCRGGGTAASQPPAASDPPAVSTPPAGDPLGRGTIVNADSGLRVRSGPGTSYEVLASLNNGDSITVVAEAGDGWYEITFSGPGGADTTGYIMGEYISFS